MTMLQVDEADPLIEQVKDELTKTKAAYSPSNVLSEDLLAYGTEFFSRFPRHLVEERWSRIPSYSDYGVMRTNILQLPNIGKYPIRIYFCVRYDTRMGTYDVILSDEAFDMATNMQFGEPKFTEKFKTLTLQDVKEELQRRVGERFLASFEKSS